jgi:hypothetical protein
VTLAGAFAGADFSSPQAASKVASKEVSAKGAKNKRRRIFDSGILCQGFMLRRQSTLYSDRLILVQTIYDSKEKHLIQARTSGLFQKTIVLSSHKNISILAC